MRVCKETKRRVSSHLTALVAGNTLPAHLANTRKRKMKMRRPCVPFILLSYMFSLYHCVFVSKLLVRPANTFTYDSV